MVGRVSTLAGIATLMGAVAADGAAGCTSDDDGVAATDADAATTAKDAGRDVFVPVGGGDDEQPESCASKDPVDAAKIPYEGLEVAGCVFERGGGDAREVITTSRTRTMSRSPGGRRPWARPARHAHSRPRTPRWGPLLVEGDEFVGVSRGRCIEIARGKDACVGRTSN